MHWRWGIRYSLAQCRRHIDVHLSRLTRFEKATTRKATT
jgi:hypothetical protein